MRIIILTALIALAGCKANIVTEIKASDLTGKGDLSGDVFLEISGCDDYKDSRKPSSSLIKAQDKMGGIFQGSKYVTCFSKNFKSYAQFSLPIAIDRVIDGKPASASKINIVTNSKSFIGLSIPPRIRDRLERLKADSFGMSGIDMGFEFTFTNDSPKTINLAIQGSFVDDTPVMISSYTFKQGNRSVIRLGDVAIASAMQGDVVRIALENK